MERFRLTKTQEQFWAIHNMYKGNTAYNIPSVFKIEGAIDAGILEDSLQKLVARHDILRVNILEEDHTLYQIINNIPGDFVIEVARCAQPLPGTSIPREVYDEIHKPFDLKNDPLLRVKLFRYGKGLSFLTIVFHHIIVDLRSKEIFANELSERYNSALNYQPVEKGKPPYNFKDFAGWYQAWGNSPEAAKMAENWKNELGDSISPISLPPDFDRPSTLKPDGERLNFILDPGRSAKIKEFAKDKALSPFVVLLSAYAILLGRLSNQKEFNIGVPISNRRAEGSKDAFGCFMNIVPVRINLEEGVNVNSLLAHVRQKMMFAHRNQEIPLTSLLANQNYRAGSGSNMLFQAGFTFEPLMELHLNGVKTEPVWLERKGAQLELFLVFFEKAGKYHGTFEYSTSLFSKQTIARWKNIFIKILDSMIESPESGTGDLNIIPENEWDLIKSWNDTAAPFEDNLCIHKKFESQAKKTPGNIALEYYGEELTYREMNEHTNRLAHYLLEKGIKVKDRVGICLYRSFEQMIAIFATLKAGAVYVPLEPNAPKERSRMVIDDARLKFILTIKSASANIEDSEKNIYIDNILKNNISEVTSNPDVAVKANNLAYIIYTSGSTGRPKGVMIEHRSVMNKIGWMQKTYPVNSGDEIIQKTPITFDVSVWELFWWTFNGGKLVILKPDGEKDPKSIAERIKANNPSAIIFVPSVFSLFVDYLITTGQAGCLSAIKWIVLIGEALPPALINKYHKMMEGKDAPMIVNTYGPTEATVAVSWFECPAATDLEKIYIGRPIDNTGLYVINDNNRLQPVGVQGELVITGVNLARGYHAAPGLTAEKFIHITLPYGNEVRAYKTGDLATWDRCGELDFIGRMDNQVKFNGIRIELGDIETKLLEHPDVNEAAVIVSEVANGNKTLVGYVVPSNGERDMKKGISEFLHKKLPPYMIPSHIVELEKMPLTTSGKINRRLLPVPVFSSNDTHIEPVSTIEKQLAGLWKEVLNLENIGISDNFFELGGSSLLAVTLATKIQERIDPGVDVLKIMEYPNIKAFTGFLSDLKNPPSEISDSIQKKADLRKKARRMARIRNN